MRRGQRLGNGGVCGRGLRGAAALGGFASDKGVLAGHVDHGIDGRAHGRGAGDLDRGLDGLLELIEVVAAQAHEAARRLHAQLGGLRLALAQVGLCGALRHLGLLGLLGLPRLRLGAGVVRILVGIGNAGHLPDALDQFVALRHVQRLDHQVETGHNDLRRGRGQLAHEVQQLFRLRLPGGGAPIFLGNDVIGLEQADCVAE